MEDQKVISPNNLSPVLGEEGAKEAYTELLEAIREHTGIRDLTKVESAYRFANAAHGNQLRKDGSLYITHPLKVAAIVAEMGLDEDSIVAAILHDVIEDTAITHENVAHAFGESVAEIVEGVTKLTRVIYTSKEDEQMENLRKMFLAMAKDIRVILIKIADRLHNMRTMNYQSAVKQREKSLETMEIYAPIAHRLGMQKLKLELEDLALIYLDPVGYHEIERELNDRGGKYEGFMDRTAAAIEDRMKEIGIDCTVQCRVKDIYSIYRKMYGQSKELSEVMDVYAFRVIVNEVADCYNVLGCIHEMYKPIPGRFKDYIGTPKPNMYQSLHTTVIGSLGIPFEVQIRTWEMHQTAEYGIAAHWKYKEGISRKNADEEKFAWIRNLLESQQDSDAQDFFSTLKVDLFADEVYVFTPNGDVKNLPAGATPIDFAYSIHSAVGNRMSIAKVNGRIVPFSHQLQSGDIVEIITSASSRGPSRDWLTLVKSSEARNKIRAWFKKERREENIASGREAFEAEMRRQDVPMSALEGEALDTILKRFSYHSLDDIYASIGYGGLSAQKTVNRLRDELKAMEKKTEKNPGLATSAVHGHPVHGIIVEGLDNCLVKFSHCCMPVPGDEIAGFITRGFGVSIHRTDCKNYQSSAAKEENQGRWVRVAWASTRDERYQTGIAITARDREGLVMDIAAVLGGLKIKVTSYNARAVPPDRATIYITVEVSDKQTLALAITKLMSVKNVQDIRRQGN